VAQLSKQFSQLSKQTVAMSLATAGIHRRATISQRLPGAMEDCSIVRGRRLRTARQLYVAAV